ncbi:MAG: hypothetical protein LBE36_13530 [Flavobacteriaceae bacterium]|jgi:hypothetical protein|nr:hypothetical protein [Flavobacteriaceae bacterium]
MGTLIFIAVTFITTYIIISASLFKVKKFSLGIVVTTFFTSVIITFVITLFFVIIAISIPNDRHNLVEYRYTNIYSLSSHTQISGNFILGSGQIDSETYYYYFKKSGDGYILDKTPTNEIVIIENNRQHPALRVAKYERTNKFMLFFFGKHQYSNIDAIIIPEGSLIQQYNPNY